MRAVVIDRPASPDVLEICNVPTRTPRPGEVLIWVEAFGLNRSELYMRLHPPPHVRDPIYVTAWRVPVDQIHTGDVERIAWLDEQWVLGDEQVGQGARNAHANQQHSASHQPEQFSK